MLYVIIGVILQNLIFLKNTERVLMRANSVGFICYFRLKRR